MIRISLLTIPLAACVSLIGCQQQQQDSGLKITPVSYSQYVLKTEPGRATEVLDFKEHAADGESVIVAGRIGGGIDPWIKGRSAFLLVDSGAPMPCEDERCEECAKEIAECATVVKIVNDQGKVLAVDSRELLGIKEEDEVIVQGKAKRDDDGNVAIMGTGIYVKK
jgi:hypothetical protein